MFRKKRPEEAPTFWIATSDLPSTPANAFYQQLDRALTEFQFGEDVRRLAAPFYEMDPRKGGQPGIDPEVYFKMLMVGFFENVASERAIAMRCADSLSIRAFLHYGLGEQTPHHSSFTVIRQRLASEVYDAVFALVRRALRAKKLLQGNIWRSTPRCWRPMRRSGPWNTAPLTAEALYGLGARPRLAWPRSQTAYRPKCGSRGRLLLRLHKPNRLDGNPLGIRK